MERVEHRVDFLNPVQQTGLNLTVRLGVRSYAVGDLVTCYETGHAVVVALGTVERVREATMGTLTDEMLESEHDPSCRTVEGLWVAMKRAYGDKVAPDSVVTLLFYRVFYQV